MDQAMESFLSTNQPTNQPSEEEEEESLMSSLPRFSIGKCGKVT
jgi:hypothetical protein